MSKGYTISYFSGIIGSASVGSLKKLGVASVVAPRLGKNSIKIEALNTWLGGNLFAIESGKGRFAGLGKSSRTRLLKALALRYKNGIV